MFTGFSPESIDFLWGIRMNNNREWFLQHKKEYVDHVYEPMKALGKALFEPFLDEPGNELKVSRIYRDARMHHPLPYKESIWCCIRKADQYWAESPCLYAEITPEGVSYGFLLWRPRPAVMENFRKRLEAEPRPFLEMLEKAQREAGFAMTVECYKKPKETKNDALLPYFAWRQGFVWAKEVAPGEEMFGKALLEDARKLFAALRPVYEYFCSLQSAL